MFLVSHKQLWIKASARWINIKSKYKFPFLPLSPCPWGTLCTSLIHLAAFESRLVNRMTAIFQKYWLLYIPVKVTQYKIYSSNSVTVMSSTSFIQKIICDILRNQSRVNINKYLDIGLWPQSLLYQCFIISHCIKNLSSCVLIHRALTAPY